VQILRLRNYRRVITQPWNALVCRLPVPYDVPDPKMKDTMSTELLGDAQELGAGLAILRRWIKENAPHDNDNNNDNEIADRLHMLEAFREVPGSLNQWSLSWGEFRDYCLQNRLEVARKWKKPSTFRRAGSELSSWLLQPASWKCELGRYLRLHQNCTF
jgi:hypothetical protein